MNKICKWCKVEKDATSFAKSGGKIGHTCKTCYNEKRKIRQLESGITKSIQQKYLGYSHAIISRYKSNAKLRNLEFSIDIKYAIDLLLEQNFKCKISGQTIELKKKLREHQKGLSSASLDRIDSSKGYIEGNVQWVRKDINFMKQEYSMDYFIETCKLIAEHNKEI